MTVKQNKTLLHYPEENTNKVLISTSDETTFLMKQITSKRNLTNTALLSYAVELIYNMKEDIPFIINELPSPKENTNKILICVSDSTMERIKNLTSMYNFTNTALVSYAMDLLSRSLDDITIVMNKGVYNS